MKAFAQIFTASVLYLYLASCGIQQPKQPDMSSPIHSLSDFDAQGHRGCRGLYPENTIEGFQHALSLGVRTLELDVVITSDSVVVCSHEPWFSHEISTTPSGDFIDESEERKFAIYRMPFAEVETYDVGMKPHLRFPSQQKIAATKPSLASVIELSDAYAREVNRPLPHYNIETKTTPEGDGIMHPKPEAFCDLLLQVINHSKIADRCTVQSFDPRTLQYFHRIRPEIALVLLVENQLSLEENVKNLGFTPEVYSPDYTLVSKETVAECHALGMKIIPWTINETDDMKAAIDQGVDGIITDYPDRLMPLVRH